MAERIDDLFVRQDPVGRDQASEFDAIREPAAVLCEGTRRERPDRKHAECGANELTACHTHVRRHASSAPILRLRHAISEPRRAAHADCHERTTTRSFRIAGHSAGGWRYAASAAGPAAIRRSGAC